MLTFTPEAKLVVHRNKPRPSFQWYRSTSPLFRRSTVQIRATVLVLGT